MTGDVVNVCPVGAGGRPGDLGRGTDGGGGHAAGWQRYGLGEGMRLQAVPFHLRMIVLVPVSNEL